MFNRTIIFVRRVINYFVNSHIIVEVRENYL